MATEIIMPKLGLTMTEGVLVRWIVEEGEPVTQGQPIAEIETDKIATEIESPANGILGQIVVQEGETVLVTETIAWVVQRGERVSTPQARPARSEGGEEPRQTRAAMVQLAEEPSTQTKSGRPKATPNARRIATELGIELSKVSPRRPGARITGDDVRAYARQSEEAQRVRVSPVARKMAKDHGLDLGTIQGTGPGGRIVREDVEAVLDSRQEATVVPVVPTPAPVVEVVPVRGVRGIIAQRMSESHRTTARVTLTVEADATDLAQLRGRLKADMEKTGDPPISYNDLLAKIVALCLQEHPEINARFEGEDIHRLADVNVGIAVDSERGLLVPVVRNVARKSVLEISREIRELVSRARAGTSRPDDLVGGTFTITNMGMLEIDAFTPIINLPECAILGIGRIKERPAVHEGQIVARSLVWLSLTFDHRVVDGAPAARFLRRVKHFVEEPHLLVLYV